MIDEVEVSVHHCEDDFVEFGVINKEDNIDLLNQFLQDTRLDVLQQINRSQVVVIEVISPSFGSELKYDLTIYKIEDEYKLRVDLGDYPHSKMPKELYEWMIDIGYAVTTESSSPYFTFRPASKSGYQHGRPTPRQAARASAYQSCTCSEQRIEDAKSMHNDILAYGKAVSLIKRRLNRLIDQGKTTTEKYIKLREEYGMSFAYKETDKRILHNLVTNENCGGWSRCRLFHLWDN